MVRIQKSMGIQETIDAFRKDIENRERTAANRMVRAYGAAYLRVLTAFNLLEERIRNYREENDGRIPTESWLYQEERFVQLLRQIRSEIDNFGRYATTTITAQQTTAIDAAMNNSTTLVREALTDVRIPFVPKYDGFTQLHAKAVEQMVGQSGDGGPLAALIERIAPTTITHVRQSLVDAVTQGNNPRELARVLKDSMGVGLDKALTISRTEVLRSYRNASIINFQLNDDVLAGWQWSSAKSMRTCPMCLAMDGKIFPLDIPFGSHPNCRCSPAPVTKGYAKALGIDDTELYGSNIPSERETGEEWFNAQEPEQQRLILGREKYNAWASGEVKSISAFIGYRVDRDWGVIRWERSMKAVREGQYAEPPVSTIPRIRIAQPLKEIISRN